MQTTQMDLSKLLPHLVPNGIRVEGDDYLLVSSLNTVANVTLTIAGRMILPNGRPQPFRDRHVATADRVAATSTIRLGEGWLQELTTIVEGAAPLLGQTFVRVDLVRGDGAGRNVHATLIQGPVTAFLRAAWPGTPVQTTIGLPGAIRALAGTDPAAGAELAETVPTGARWRFISLRAALVTDATVANRTPVLTFDNGVTPFAGAGGSFKQAASHTYTYHYADLGASHAQSIAGVMVTTPANLILPAGFRIRTLTGGIVAGDNWGAPALLVEEWLEGS